VAFNFRPSPSGRGDADFQCGRVTSLHMDPSTRKLLYGVQPMGQSNTNMKTVHLIREGNIGYAAGCPVTIGAEGQGAGADGQILIAYPKFGSHGKAESVAYAAVLHLKHGKRRILSNVPATRITYRHVKGHNVSSVPSEEKQMTEETQPSPKPVPLAAAESKTKEKNHDTAPTSRAKRMAPRKRARNATNKKPRPVEATRKKYSNAESYAALSVGSRVNVLLNGVEWQATILGDSVKGGELGLMVHYEGLKAKSRHWVSVDQIASLVSP